VLSSTKLREGTPRRTVGLAMCALCVGLFAWAVPLMISDRQLRGEPPCDLQCKSKLPILPSLAESYLTLVEHAVRGVLYEVPPVGQIASLKVHRGTDDTHTMLPVEGLQNFRSAIEKVIVDGIPGDVAELGVWRGGASLFAKAVLDAYGQSMRRIHLFDVFDSLDLHGYGKGVEFGKFATNSVRAINSSFARYGLLDGRVDFYEGLFNQTTRKFRERNKDGSIAVLRVDGNFYKSYQDVMYNLYELVPIGGIVIFDDWVSHVAIRAFWSDFCADYKIDERMNKVDQGISWFRKSRQIQIDWSKEHRSPAVRMASVDSNVGR